MATKAKFQAIKGTRDLLPPETELWNRVEQTAREVFGTYGFGEIRPPIFEPTELFARSIGLDTDVVSKEMFASPDPPLFAMPDFAAGWEKLKELAVAYDPPLGTISPSDRNMILADARRWTLAAYTSLRWSIESATNNLISLRPEATASVCRAYIEHNMHAWPQPVKLYYTGPMFRRERPQKGRYRQFYQIGAEVLETLQPGQSGSKDIPKDAAVDAEVIEMVMVFFARLELPGAQLEINSIGCRECRPKYVELLRAELQKVKEKLGADSQRRIETNPLRVLDSKLEHEQGIIEKLPRIGEHLCTDCARHYAEVKRQLGMRGVEYKENWRLVRGLDYYMRTTFEITAKGLGSQNAVCGGGRYDGLVELLGGPPTKGIGFAIGEDRLILSLQEAGKGATAVGRDVYIAWMGEKAQETAITAAGRLRNAGFCVELPPVEQKFGKALERAAKLGSRYALILGEDEVASGEWTVKRLEDGTQEKIAAGEIVEVLKRKKPV